MTLLIQCSYKFYHTRCPCMVCHHCGYALITVYTQCLQNFETLHEQGAINTIRKDQLGLFMKFAKSLFQSGG